MGRRGLRRGKYQPTTHIAVVLLLMIVFALVGYFFWVPAADSPPVDELAEQTLQAQGGEWRSRQPLSYRYVVKRTCDCPAIDNKPFVVSEIEGRRSADFPVEVEAEDGQRFDSPPRPVWIDDLFDVIAESIDRGDSVRVRYDRHYGFPSSVHIVLSNGESELRYEIRDFEVLQHRSLQ